MNYKLTAFNTYKKFSEFEGNEHIAGDYALEKILELTHKFKVRKVLEIGLGIGSICDAILTDSKKNDLNIKYTGTEANEFCLNALQRNVTYFKEIQLFSDVQNVEKKINYDLIIVDGSDSSLSKIEKLCDKNAIIFIEGGRASQVGELKQLFPKYLYAEIISLRKPPAYGPFHQKWTGGGGLIFINPTFPQKVFWITEKIKTFAKRRMRKFIQ